MYNINMNDNLESDIKYVPYKKLAKKNGVRLLLS